MATYTETFNKADGTGLGPDLTWSDTESETGSVSGNAGTFSGFFTLGAARAEHNTSSDDMFIEAEWTVGDSANDRSIELRGRYSSSQVTFYGFEVNDQNNRYKIFKLVNGAYDDLVGFTTISGGVTPGAGKKARMEIQGSTLKVYWDGALLNTVTDTDILTGKRAGIGTYNSNSVLRFDNFTFGDIGGANVTGDVTLSSSSGMTPTGTTVKQGLATLSTTSGMSATGGGTIGATASLSTGSSMTASGVVNPAVSGILTSRSAMTAAGSNTALGFATLSTASSMIAFAFGGVTESGGFNSKYVSGTYGYGFFGDGFYSGAQAGQPGFVGDIPAYLFTCPVVFESYSNHRLFSRIKTAVAITVLKVNGLFITVRDPEQAQLAAAERVYLGGHHYPITPIEAAELYEAGYGKYISPLDN